MSETKTLWQRCEALGRFEDYKDDHVEMLFASGRGVIRHDGQCILFIYKDKVRGSEWLADAILCHIERLRFGIKDSKSYCQEDLNRAGVRNICKPITGDVPTIVVPTEISDRECQRFIESLTQSREGMIDRLPDVTYVVEAPKQTEPTQEQLKAIWDYVTHLRGEQAESFGFQYAVIASPIQPRFELKIETLQSSLDEWLVTIIHTADGEFIFSSTYSFAGTCSRLGCFDIARGIVTESPLQFVSIPVTEWQQLREAHKTIQSILFPEIKDVEFES